MSEPTLRDLRVLEIGGGIAASLTTMLLAEHGADVVRIGSAGADPVLDAICGRGKTEVDMTAHDPSWHPLLDRADVVVAAPEAPDIPWDRAREHNPGLVTCRIAAFPSEDPRAALPPSEAVAGMAGFLFDKPLGRPVFHDFSVGAVISGIYGAIGVMAALIARERDGHGQQVDSSYYEASLSAQVLQILAKTGLPRSFMPLRMVGSPFMRVWRCGDGRYVYLHITMPKHNLRMLEILAQNGYAREAADIRSIMSAQTLRDPSQVGSIGEAKRLKAVYQRLFASKPALAWEQMLASDLCCIKIRTIDEWLEESRAAGMSDACRLDDPALGDLVAPGATVDCHDRPVIVEPRVLAGAIDEVSGRWPARPARELSEPSTEPPLAGVRVADLSRIIAGPCAARILAELGAEVLSIQSETRLDWALSFHLLFNAGKRSVTLDFTDAAGKERLWAILDDLQPDVLIHNYRHLELAETIGVGPEQVRARFPAITYTHLNAYGNQGEWRDRPGFEQVVQAISGIQLAYARGGRPKLLPSPVIDIGCGLLGAFASLVGLFEARRTGRGLASTTHLTTLSVLLQLPQVAATQRARAPIHADRELLSGMGSALGRPVVVAGSRAELARWAGALRTGNGSSDVVAAATRALRWRRLSDWRRSLANAGVGQRVALMPHPAIARIADEAGAFDPRPAPIVRRRSFPGSPRPLAYVRCPLRLSRTPLADIEPPPVRGFHTREVLARIGVDVPPDTGVVHYPPELPLLKWLATVLRWGYFAWRSGNI
jgi:crotonobetainyl-CoA:carnitine CoA-transferase CaiB-like acyl-CoA transferase